MGWTCESSCPALTTKAVICCDLTHAKQKHMGKNSEHMGVSIVMGIPQTGWFVVENPTKMDDN